MQQGERKREMGRSRVRMRERESARVFESILFIYYYFYASVSVVTWPPPSRTYVSVRAHAVGPTKVYGSKTPAVTGVWTHIVMTWRNATNQVDWYINGVFGMSRTVPVVDGAPYLWYVYAPLL